MTSKLEPNRSSLMPEVIELPARVSKAGLQLAVARGILGEIPVEAGERQESRRRGWGGAGGGPGRRAGGNQESIGTGLWLSALLRNRKTCEHFSNASPPEALIH